MTTDVRLERNRAAAIEAARTILVEEGWDAVTQARVAQCSGLGRATIYRYWPDRVLLLHDALAACAASVVSVVSVAAVSSTDDFRRDLLTFLEAMRYALVDQKVGRVVSALVSRAEWDPQANHLRAELIRDGLGPVRQLLQRGVTTGKLRSGLDLDRAVARLMGPILFAVFLPTKQITKQFLRNLVDDFLSAEAVRRTDSPRRQNGNRRTPRAAEA